MADQEETKEKNAKLKGFRLAALIILLLAAVAVVIIINSSTSGPFRLSDEYYGASEMITGLTKDDYEKLLSEKKSFIVMIDKPGCVTTPQMRENMASFPDKMQFRYYQFMWSEARESSIHEYVTFVPSVAIIREGKVVAWLRADSDEDTEYFNSAEALQRWIEKYVAF